MTNSLRLRLLLWLLLPLTIYVLAAGFMARDSAQKTASLIQDNALLASARVMAGDVKWDESDLHADISPSAIEILSSPYGDRVFFRIKVIDGPPIAGTSDLEQVEPATSPGWYDTQVDGQAVRAVSIIRPMYDSGESKRILVSVGRTELERDALAADLWRPQLLHFAEIIAIAVVLVCVGLTFELRHLMALTKDVRDRAPSELVPLSSTHLQSELRPIVDAINQCIARIERQTAMQRRFISHAAHQLRTPLTLLGAQLQYARRHDDLATVKETLSAMHKSNGALVSLTNQLLLLAQAETADYSHFEGERVDLREIATTVIEELALLAARREIELAAQLANDAVVLGNARLLSVLIFNLVDNAIRYTPESGHVSLVIERRGKTILLIVTDDGPGISSDVRDRVFEPFFRASAEEGSGLGLAIVREIARAHRAHIRLDDGHDGKGLGVFIEFPC
ncbi:histidine kinase [Burkholderia sp. Leaf177]|uniref:sensor histidine kinase n=1 Tax=Burkholderia sp. Leaf177 TaxID=1736287 RepID=UPI0006F9D934|nr:sensor histidine kinase [Burkholderia sp. Leaf177]KQR74270.1 histidine kinase [Burkholderia sp. Leaf177]